MKLRNITVLAGLACAALMLSTNATAQLTVLPDYQQIATIPVPGGLTSFDISWVDPSTDRYYLADRASTKKGSGRIDVIDARQNKFLYTIPSSPAEIGFAGNLPGGVGGPNGVVAIPQFNQLYVGDGDSTVKVVDLEARAVVAVISTGGSKRADELAYDPADHIILIANASDSPPFLTFISADTQTVLGTITYPQGQVGLEQPVWNPQTNRFLISVPAVGTKLGSVDEIDPIAMRITNSFVIPTCSPAGLALGPIQRTMTSCGTAVDGRTGAGVATLAGVTGDEIWFNPGDNRYYFGATNVLVIDAETNSPLGYLTTSGGHSIAVNSNNGYIFVPVTGAGIKVFARVRK